MNTARQRIVNDDFVRRSFRDPADHDYILARVAFRHGLYLQFIALGHQALERYLKAILLFNDISTKHLSHDVVGALRDVRNRVPFPITIPHEVDEFIAHVNRQASRYFEYTFGASGRTLIALDGAVWHIRRYCEDMHRIKRADDGTISEEFAFDERINSQEYLDKPNQFRHFTGALEAVLAGSNPQLRRHLIWRNAFYGRIRKVNPRDLGGGYAANPTLVLHPEAFEHFDQLVQFSREYRRQMRDARRS